ncbi:decapping and exoribonuclease protein Rai1-like [Musca autumnalis]|uniref:decapping and exoribonuclease protein Rai1-like n=1 Tax=Musca autumnalis TaxID=221902 RepID=UPI003CF09640
MACKLLHINSADFDKFEQTPEYMTRPRIVKIYDINYTRFTPAKKLSYLFKTPNLSEYPLDISSDLGTPIELKYSTQTGLLNPLLHTYFGCDENENDLDDSCVNRKNNHNKNVEMIDVYSRRGALEKIMAFCYDKNDFGILVSRYNGKIFMIERPKNEETFEKEQTGNTHHRRLIQITSVAVTPDESNGNDDNIFQTAVYEANLAKYNLHYGGRTQFIKIADESKNNLSDMNKIDHVAVKQMWSTIRDKNIKLLRYWLQGYLANVRELYLAYKDQRGIVQSPMECYKSCEIPKKCYWKPSVCTTFLNVFLDKVEDVMTNVDSVDIVYEFQFHGLNKIVQYTKRSGIGFIPKEYADKIKEL